jgi:Thioredoxin
MPRRANRLLTALATRLTLIHEEGGIGRCPPSPHGRTLMIVFPFASLGRVEGGDGIVEGRDVADVRPQPSVPHPLHDLPQLGTIGLDNEIDHVRGLADAPVTVIEYGDYECPYCQGAARDVHLLLDRYPGTVQFVFRNFPIPQLHPHAEQAAEAAEAAASQGKFWEM